VVASKRHCVKRGSPWRGATPPRPSQKANALKAVLQEAGQALYAQAPQTEAQQARAASPASGARVVDAEYRDTAGAKP
jgi:hypothetical protein